MNYRNFVGGELETNCYLVWSGVKAGIIDPGGSVDELVNFIEDHSFQVCWIINTHGHVDHILGNAELSRKFAAPILIHAADRFMLTSAKDNLSFVLGCAVTSPDASKTVEDGEILLLGEENFKILATPGHSPGGISLYTPGLAFTGDALFYESIGRTDFPGGDYRTLLRSIKEKLFSLPPETRVLPGHGQESTIKHEIENNQFVKSES